MGARSRVISHLGTWDYYGLSRSHRRHRRDIYRYISYIGPGTREGIIQTTGGGARCLGSLLRASKGEATVLCVFRDWWLWTLLLVSRDKEGNTGLDLKVTSPVAQAPAPSVWPAPPRPRPFYDADDYRKIHPDGRIASDSAAATPQAGHRLIEASAASVVTDYQGFLAEI